MMFGPNCTVGDGRTVGRVTELAASRNGPAEAFVTH